MSFSIVIVDVDVGTPTVELSKTAAALQRQVLEHFFPSWGVSATVRSAAVSGPASRDDWVLELRRTPTHEGILGIHQVTPSGAPMMLVFPFLDARDDVPWTVTASHEILETLVDPWLRRGAQDDDGVWWASEVCDPVESDTYVIDNVVVSNFCLPAWSEPPTMRSGVRYDHLGLCRRPWEIREGGYAQRYDPVAHAWRQIGHMRSARLTLRALGMSRGARR